MPENLIEGRDYYINREGKLVFSASYLKSRKSCCGNGCQNCPYEYENVEEPKRSKLLSLRKNEKGTK